MPFFRSVNINISESKRSRNIMLLSLDFATGNLEKACTRERLVTTTVASRLRALLKFESMVFRSFSDNQFSRAAIVLVDDPLIEVVSNIFLMMLISHSNEYDPKSIFPTKFKYNYCREL